MEASAAVARKRRRRNLAWWAWVYFSLSVQRKTQESIVDEDWLCWSANGGFVENTSLVIVAGLMRWRDGSRGRGPGRLATSGRGLGSGCYR
ncbi:hypothetical protein LZ554_009188 [Drepanopeziza brunnea f. sp. 'monogermtubi']|nr:hypothetical protein LZ554_009188 [Drepanopeziza brunnea f. sp. 'monogermtubi']